MTKNIKQKNIDSKSKEWNDAIKEHDKIERKKDPMNGLIYHIPSFTRAWNDRKGS
jgi:hypothetical protein